MFYPGKYKNTSYSFFRIGQIVWFWDFIDRRARKAKVVRLEKCFEWAKKTTDNLPVNSWEVFVVIKALDKNIEFSHGSAGSSYVTDDGIYPSKQSCEQDFIHDVGRYELYSQSFKNWVRK